MLNVKNGDAGWRLQASSSSPSSQCVQKELFSHHLFFVGDGGISPLRPLSPLTRWKLPKRCCVGKFWQIRRAVDGT